MNTVDGVIVSIAGSLATIEVESAVGCARCAAGKGCGAALFGKRQGTSRIIIEVANDASFREGDPVSLSLPSAQLLRASIWAYGLPLAGALLFLLLGLVLVEVPQDDFAILLAASGMVAGFVLGRQQLRQECKARHFVPRLTRRDNNALRR